MMSPCQRLMQKFQDWIKELKYYWLCSYLWTVSRLKMFFHCKLLEVSVWDCFFGPTTGTPWVPNLEGEENYCQILKETQQVWSHHHINPHVSQFCCMVSLLRPLFKAAVSKIWSQTKNVWKIALGKWIFNSECKCSTSLFKQTNTL